ncbi:hypothetical protein [Actinomadura sp. WMMB 499]|uniref:hypothetical protein n=1 Tax=Actinomadura sp. WMMB 499 TaxID=1219491 RepID=UPI0012468EBE|nr:hypothetical protein [Actinomadura sp. WMMB 499]QFG25022.1 hypothetical protein F7P10_31690 [Actinomadura sp. WMMB 499]
MDHLPKIGAVPWAGRTAARPNPFEWRPPCTMHNSIASVLCTFLIVRGRRIEDILWNRSTLAYPHPPADKEVVACI